MGGFVSGVAKGGLVALIGLAVLSEVLPPPGAEGPVADGPVSQSPTAKVAGAETPTAESPAPAPEPAPAAETSAGPEVKAEEPKPEQPAPAVAPAAETPVGPEPRAEEPAAEQPAPAQPAASEPAGPELGGPEPGGPEPAPAAQETPAPDAEGQLAAPAPAGSAPVAAGTPAPAAEPGGSTAKAAPAGATSAEALPEPAPADAPASDDAPLPNELPATSPLAVAPLPPAAEPGPAAPTEPLLDRPQAAARPEPAPAATPAPDTTPEPGLDGAVAGVTTGRLPVIAPAAPDAATQPETPAADVPPRLRYAVPFENPQAKPLFAVILIDDGRADLDRDTLARLPLPLTIALDPADAGSPARAALYRANGKEIALLATGLPKGATPSDIAVTLDAAARALPETVAVVDVPTGGFQNDLALASDVVPVIGDQGRGLVTLDAGLNAADQVARREGVASAVVFRRLDAENEGRAIIRRYLDRAAFKAAQDGQVTMLGTASPETLAALVEWSVEGRAGSVALAPLSAVLAQGR